MNEVPRGVWPTMITPFEDDGIIDWIALGSLVEWYQSNQVNGLFAVCQSSEMFYLSLEERVKLAAYVVKKANGKLPVIASGHISDRMDDQLREIAAISATGIDTFVLLTNRLAGEKESDEAWIRNAEHILAQFPDQTFGLYECPYPYKRLLSPALIDWCSKTGRFRFIKDTCCDPEWLTRRIDILRGSSLQLFNANSATLLGSLRMGASGFSGVMANFHPDLYVWLTRHALSAGDRADKLQDWLGIASLIETQSYPASAKYNLQLEGLPIGLYCRSRRSAELDGHAKLVVRQLRESAERIRADLHHG